MLFRKINTAIFVFIATTSVAFASSTNDLTITAEVKTKLLQEQDIPTKNIEVITKDGIVSLKGMVDTHLQAHRAIEVASSVDNVKDVVDTGLKIKESKSIITDAVITAKVKGKIRHLYINKKIGPGYDLHVETTNGIVHLFGHVAREMDVDTIADAAKEVKGVKSVKTNIGHS